MENLAFKMEQKVSIKLSGKHGVVCGLYVGRLGPQFDVEYVNDKGEVVRSYFTEGELTAS